MTTDQDKLERERAFHNVAFSENSRASASRFYSVVGASRGRYRDLLGEHAGQRVLEIGCGRETDAVRLAQMGCDVVGIDISDEAIAQSQQQVKDAGVEAQFVRMNAESTDFPDASFDVVCGSSIVHHLDTEAAYREIARVLRPAGRAIFVEPTGHNPLINAYRRRTPQMRTPDEHPLVRHDFELAERYFRRTRIEFFELAALAAVPVHGTRAFAPVLSAARAVDRLLARTPARWWAWNVVMTLER
jgi:SAM-dependent methyltransferase